MNRLRCFSVLAIATLWAAATVASELAGTAWQLVRIQSMDDSVYAADDRARYTLAFEPDGTARMKADCNRGQGSWHSEASGQLRFGPVAATRAMCPPGSLSEKYLAQFEWVRSYVRRDGHLFLATMADGAIIEFEPVDDAPAVATVLGEAVHTTDVEEVQAAIITRLFDQYAAEQGIAAEPAEIDAFVDNLRHGMAAEGLTADTGLTAEDAAALDVMRRQMARSIIRQWKINKALYESYGGRIIYQQLGPEPLDAYRRFFEQRQAAGAFEIRDPIVAERFWRYFTDESIHDFMEPGGADESRAFAVPPWVGSRAIAK
ncbi:MAG: META domain-containing protein [Gammaproteobacteria bacterium]|nr:META domain-containing protein [Gammaproteobacteria bacterium]